MAENPYAQYATNPYAVYGTARQPSPQTPAQSQGDVLQNVRREQEIANNPLQQESTRVNIQQGRTSIANAGFDNKAKLRNDFNALPEVKNYSETLQALGSALQAPDSPQGDLAIIYAFAKAQDPGSVVREGEMDMANSTASLVDRIRQQYGMIGEGKRLPPEVRLGLVEAMRQKGSALKSIYEQQRDRYSDLARQNGFDPAEIIGRPLQEAYRPAEEAYIRAHGGTPRDPDVPQETAANVGGFNDELPPNLNPMSEAQQSAYDAWLRANPNATPDQLRAFATSIGLPGVDNAEQIIEHLRKTGKFAPGATAEQRKPDISDVRSEANPNSFDAFARGIADIPTFGTSEKLAAGVNTIFANDKPYKENLAREYAITDFDKENNFAPRLAGQVVGGFGLPMGEMATLPQIAAKGAAVGGAYGLGSSRSLQEVPQNVFLNALAGGTIPTAISATPRGFSALSALAGRKMAGDVSPEQFALLRAGEEENVPVNMGDVFPNLRNTIATQETIPLSAGPIRQGIQAGRDAIERRVSDLGRGGTPRENMGQAIQDAGHNFVAKANNQADRLYTRARAMAGNTPINPVNTKNALSNLVVQEASTPGGTRAGAVIKQYADAFKNRALLNIDGARRMRSELLARLRTDGGLSKKQATRLTDQIMGAVNADIEAALTASGKRGAVDAYRAADKFYAQSRNEIERTIEKFIGNDNRPMSVEQTISAMQNAAGPKGNAKALTGMLARMSPEERSDYAATLAEKLGRKSPDEPFSPGTFLTNIRQLSPAARRIVFGSEGEKSINNLIRLSTAKQESVQRLNNSRSGQVTNYRAVLSNLLVGLPGGGALVGAGAAFNGATGAAGGLAIGGSILAGSRQLAKALMNDEFTRAVANAPATTSPKAINAHFGRLKQIASKDPNVRAVVEGLEKKLLSYANDNLQRAAASENDQQNNR